GASLNIRHNLSSSKGPKPLQLKLLTTYIPKTSAFTLAFSTSQRLRTTRASARSCFRLLFLAIIQTFFLISWFSLLLLQLLRHLFYRHLKLHRQRYILIVGRLMLVMVVFFIAFRWIHLSTPLIRLFLLVLILLLMPTLNFLPVWFALSLLRFRLPSRLPMMFILWMVAMMVVIIPSRTV